MLCPVRTITQLLSTAPYPRAGPLFQQNGILLTELMLRKILNQLWGSLGLNHPTLTFHALRHTAVSLLFNSDVNFETIKRHGAWRSNVVFKYLVSSSQQPVSIPLPFKTLID